MGSNSGRPKGSKTEHIDVGWTFRDIEVIENCGLMELNEYKRGKKVRAMSFRIRHIPCGATKVLPRPWLNSWRRSSRTTKSMRCRGWCSCLPKIDKGRGYRRAKGLREHEHRVVMAKMLGRELLEGESVHHINGIRSDNRENNLELWVTFQPHGQRPSDLVEYALELLRRYAPEKIARDYPRRITA